MKRLALFTVFVALPALAFDPAPVRGDRIALLQTSAREDDRTGRVASLIYRYLAGELQRAGFDAFESGLTYDDLLGGASEDADYYVELVDGRSSHMPERGPIGVAGPGGAVEIENVAARVVAGVRLYDARTLALIDHFDVQARGSAVVPTAIGVGGRFGIWFNLPVSKVAAYRAARDAARDAARTIADLCGSSG